jgi:hypothetical protein
VRFWDFSGKVDIFSIFDTVNTGRGEKEKNEVTPATSNA